MPCFDFYTFEVMTNADSGLVWTPIVICNYQARALRALGLLLADGAPTVHYVHFVKYDDTVSFYDAVSDTIRRRV